MIGLAAMAVAAACLAVDAPADRILASDLARGLPEWSAVAPDTEVALAPVPGVVRVLRPPELQRMGERYGVVAESAAPVCFERPTAPLDPGRMLEVMRARLPGAGIEILEASRLPAPAGKLDFPLSGLRPGYWYGHVTWGAGHRFAVWARVDVKAPVKRLVASADLVIGRPVEAGQLRIETRREFPQPAAGGAEDATEQDFTGFIPRRAVAAGTVVRRAWLDAPRLVHKGETVKVEVVTGRARVETTGIALAGGALGETIAVENPDSKSRYRARVEAGGRVSVKGRS